MSDSNEKQLEVGGDFLESLSSANLANWQAINEMVANSIDAWFDMNSKSHQLVIDIQIDQQKDLDKAQLILQDNAMGMDLKTLEKAVTAFLHSDKKQGDNAHRYLGMFGFGLLGAAFTIGTELTVITTQDNKTHFKAESNVEDFKKTKSFVMSEYKPNTQEKKLFKNSGTRVIVKNFNSEFNKVNTIRYLQHSWRFFLSKNEHGKAIKINLDFSGDKHQIESVKLGFFNDRPVIDETIVPIEFELEWKPRRSNKNEKIKISGQIGLSAQGGQGEFHGGLNFYRRGQLIEVANRELYSWGAATAKFHGDLHIDLPVNFQKGGYDKQSDGWKELEKSFGQASKYFTQYTKWSVDFESQFSTDPESDDYKDFIARYKKNFNLKLTAEEQSLLSKGEKTSASEPPKKPPTTTTTVAEDEESDEDVLKVIDLISFKINKEKYKIKTTATPDEGRPPWFIVPTGSSLGIVFNTIHPNYKTISDAHSKMSTNNFAFSLIKSIYLDCIKQFLSSKNIEFKLIAEFANEYWELES